MEATISYKTADQITDSMISVYNQMGLAVLFSALTSFLVNQSPTLMNTLFSGFLMYVVIFAPLVAALALGFIIHKLSKTQAKLALYGFAVLMGLSLAKFLSLYTAASVTMAFISSAVLFGTMSLYGYFTKKDLTSMGQFLMVGVIALIIASIVNMFFASSLATTVISALAVIIFLGLTAYDTQRIREEVSVENQGNEETIGALSLYINFVNIFTSLLQLTGNRDD